MKAERKQPPRRKELRPHELAEITTFVAAFIVSLGGGGAIVLGLSNWIGRILADRYVEKLKQEIQQEIESHKTRLRKSEFLFQKEFEAASAFISLRRSLMPKYRFPEMEWHAGCLVRLKTKVNGIQDQKFLSFGSSSSRGSPKAAVTGSVGVTRRSMVSNCWANHRPSKIRSAKAA